MVMNLAQHLFLKSHHLYFDNFFSSVALMKTLIQNNTYACATVRTNTAGLPVEMKRHRKLKRGQHLVLQKNNILASMWHDNRDGSFISTNTLSGESSVQRWDNRACARVQMPCPSVVELYNDHLGGVNMADQMRRCYRTLNKSFK